MYFIVLTDLNGWIQMMNFSKAVEHLPNLGRRPTKYDVSQNLVHTSYKVISFS
jgi:DNA-binding transcriptional regulator of glucitol operon